MMRALRTFALLAATTCSLGFPAWADPPPRAELVTALAGIERAPDLATIRAWGVASTRPLMSLADDATVPIHVRTRALYALRAFPTEIVVRDYLRRVATDPARALLFRRAAFDALADGFADVETLTRALQDPSSDVRDGAAWALSRVRTPAARAAIEAALNAERDETVRTTLRTALQNH